MIKNNFKFKHIFQIFRYKVLINFIIIIKDNNHVKYSLFYLHFYFCFSLGIFIANNLFHVNTNAQKSDPHIPINP